MAEIVPFPLSRRRPLIERQARYVAKLRPDATERHVYDRLATQRLLMERSGIEVEVIDRELNAMSAAIRSGMSMPPPALADHDNSIHAA